MRQAHGLPAGLGRNLTDTGGKTAGATNAAGATAYATPSSFSTYACENGKFSGT